MALWAVVLPGLAAAQPVILLEPKVGPYRVAAQAAKAQLKEPREVDASSADVATQLQGATVIVAIGQKAFELARDGNQNTPVVACMLLGADRSLYSGKVTGVPLETDPAQVLRHIRALLPDAKRVGVVYHPGNSRMLMDEAQKAGRAQGVSLVLKEVKSPGEVRGAVSSLAGGIDVLWLPPDPRLYTREMFNSLLQLSAEQKIPLIGFLEGFTQAGALASVSPDFTQMGTRAGALAAEVLAGRGEVPPPVYTPGTLSVNLKTARALDLSLPEAAVEAAPKVFR